MSNVMFIFAAGLAGVFLVMALLYGSVKLTALFTGLITDRPSDNISKQ